MRFSNVFFVVLFSIGLCTSCAPSTEIINEAIQQTMVSWTPIPSQTPVPTYTPRPTIVITKMVTPTPKYKTSYCKPLTGMTYDQLWNSINILQTYMLSFSDVRTLSYAIPEQLYSNVRSNIVHITYVSKEDGETYSRRFIVYFDEQDWGRGVFSIDGQCWIDGPKP